ncbi:aminoacetone oxidase family FAD-binding enzyme, partial [Escherichia coli]
MERFDAIIIGAGAAGGFCFAPAGGAGGPGGFVFKGKKKQGKTVLFLGGGVHLFTPFFQTQAFFVHRFPFF